MTVTKSPYNLLRDAEALGLTPRMLLHRARLACGQLSQRRASGIDPEVVRAIARDYGRQYATYLRQQRNARQLLAAQYRRPIAAAAPLSDTELRAALDVAIRTCSLLRSLLDELRSRAKPFDIASKQ